MAMSGNKLILAFLLLIVIYRDFLCYLVYRPQDCNKLELISGTLIRFFKLY